MKLNNWRDGFDCRTVEEYNKGHVENALNVPYVFFTPEGNNQLSLYDFVLKVTKLYSFRMFSLLSIDLDAFS